MEKFWIQTVPALNALVALNVADPAKPVEASRLTFPSHVKPHWLAGLAWPDGFRGDMVPHGLVFGRR